MSFKPFQFEYRPPETVTPPPGAEARAPLGPEDAVIADAARAPLAGDLVSQIDELVATSTYLQQAIVERFRDTSVTLGLEQDPALAEALTRIYGVNEPPAAITIPMFDHLLDAEVAAVQTEMMLGKDSTLEVNSIQMADLMSATARVERYLIATGEFRYQLPVLLRSLKADTLVFNSWRAGLMLYPVMRHNLTPHEVVLDNLHKPGPIEGSIRTAQLDMERDLYNFFIGHMNGFSSVYSSVYAMMSQINNVERGITSIVETFVLQPIADITRIVGLFNGLKGLFHKDGLQNIADALGNFVFARMAAEAGEMTFLLDRFVHMAVNPLQQAVGRVGRLINVMNRTADATGRAVEGLKGISKTTTCGQAPHNQGTKRYEHQPVTIPGLGQDDVLPTALRTLGEHLSWATNASSRRRLFVDEQFRKLANRRLLEQQNRLDIMCSLNSLDSMIRLAQGFINEHQTGTNFASANQTQKIEAVGRILNSLQTGTGATFTVQGDEIVITPPDMPEPPEPVEKVLRRGGLQRITRADILRIHGATL